MNILLFGDVVGKPGRRALIESVPQLRKQHGVDLVIANVENMAHGFGITPSTIEELEQAGVDYFTSGNHIWKNNKGVEYLQMNPENVIRPANVSGELPGSGFVRTTVNGIPVLIINLLGEVFIEMEEPVQSPFDTFEQLYAEHGKDALVILDFHAEATGEKRIMGWHVDGRASVVVGTHTHVQTADEQILPQGTAYITDLGFCGAVDSSLGMRKDLVYQKVVKGVEISLEPPENPSELVASGVLVRVNDSTHKAEKIARIDQKITP